MQTAFLREVSILWCLFHILILFMLLYRSRFSRKTTILLTVLCMTPVGLANVAGLYLLGAERMGKLFYLTCTIPSLVFYYLMSKDRKGRFLFTFCVADTVAYWIIIVTNLLDYYAGGGRCILMFIGRLILFPLVEWYAYRRIRNPYIELQDSVEKGWNIFAAMAALYYALLIAMSNFPSIITSRPHDMGAYLLVLILMPMTYATIFSALYRQLLLYRKKQEDRLLVERQQQLEAQIENQQFIRRLQHDMRAHIVTLSGLLFAEKTEEAQNYLQKLISGQDKTRQIYCGNPYLNSVFSHYVMKFGEQNIPFHLDIQINEERLPYMELCQILSNGLENAYDASCRQKEAQLPAEAQIQMRSRGDWLIIRMKNRCRESLCVEKGMMPDTDKTGPEHGFGMRTIADATQRLGGEMVCFTQGGFFILDVMARGGEAWAELI